MSSRYAVRVILGSVVLAWTLSAGAVETTWSGALRLGVGGSVRGPATGAKFDGGLRVDVLFRRDDFKHWGAGPFVEGRTLDFSAYDVTAGLVIATPLYGELLGGTLRVGGGYRAHAPEGAGGVLSTTLTFGLRSPISGHEEVVFGVFVESRLAFTDGTPIGLAGGVEIDPIGLGRGVWYWLGGTR